jgi:hypothetical protein
MGLSGCEPSGPLAITGPGNLRHGPLNQEGPTTRAGLGPEIQGRAWARVLERPGTVGPGHALLRPGPGGAPVPG